MAIKLGQGITHMQLTSLQTKSWGIIKDSIIDIDDGLSVFIGETGAGKSMMIHAILYGLGLVKGDKKWIKSQHTYAEVTLNFHMKDATPEWFKKDEDGMIQITRRLHSAGRHRILCQGQLSTVQQLKTLCEPYFIASTQHSLLQIKDKNKMMAYLDLWISDQDKDCLYQSYQHIKLIEEKIQIEKNHVQPHYELSQLKQSCDEMQVLLEQLGDRTFAEIEQAHEKYMRQLHASEHLETCMAIIESEQGLSESIQTLKKKAQLLDDELIIEKLNALDEQVSEIGNLLFTKQHEDMQHEDHETLISSMNRLCKKHHTLPENISPLLEELCDTITKHNTAIDLIPSLEKELSDATEYYHNTCKIISAKRKDICQTITNIYSQYLPQVGMENALVQWHITSDSQRINKHGHDEVVVMFQANEGSQAHPVESIASGGELSRLFLIMQIIKPSKKELTFIFDEIDTGISGDIAEKVGKLISELSQKHQVFMISHLPQVACYADQIIFIKKQTLNNITCSEPSSLEQKDHVSALAQLLSSSDHHATVNHVKYLLMNAQKQKALVN